MPRVKDQVPLTKERIVTAAIDLIDRYGMNVLSMRRLAAELAVMPTALYYHLGSKAELVHAVVAAVLATCNLAVSGTWRERVQSLCHAYRQVAQRYPRVFPTAMTHTRNVPSDFAIAEALLDALEEGGLSAADAVHGYNALVTYVTGFAMDEITGSLLTFDDADAALTSLPIERFPRLHAHRSQLSSVDADKQFAFGLALLLEGLAARSGSR